MKHYADHRPQTRTATFTTFLHSSHADQPESNKYIPESATRKGALDLLLQQNSLECRMANHKVKPRNVKIW